MHAILQESAINGALSAGGNRVSSITTTGHLSAMMVPGPGTPFGGIQAEYSSPPGADIVFRLFSTH